jgi:hypothetical protein
MLTLITSLEDDEILDAFGKLDAGLPVTYAEAFDADVDPEAVLERLLEEARAEVDTTHIDASDDSDSGLRTTIVEDGVQLWWHGSFRCHGCGIPLWDNGTGTQCGNCGAHSGTSSARWEPDTGCRDLLASLIEAMREIVEESQPSAASIRTVDALLDALVAEDGNSSDSDDSSDIDSLIRSVDPDAMATGGEFSLNYLVTIRGRQWLITYDGRGQWHWDATRFGTAVTVDELIDQLDAVSDEFAEVSKRLITSADPNAVESDEGWQVTVGGETAVLAEVNENWKRVTESDS